MHPSLFGALVMAAVTTAGDYAWFEFGIRHTPVAGVLHGIVLLGTLGAILGYLAPSEVEGSRRVGIGVIGGIVAGAIGALMFYALWRALGWGAMFMAWSAVWMGLAAFDSLVLRRPGPPHSRTPNSSWVARGLAAAVLGGVAFYMISGIWTSHAEHPNYLWHFVSWFIAWWPGLAALTFGRRTPNSELRTPNSELRTPNSELRTPNSAP
jgi:hypothetical protein